MALQLGHRLLGPVWSAAAVAERGTRRLMLGAVETAANSQIAGEVAERVLASSLVERATRQALAGPLPTVIVHDVIELKLVERAAGELVGQSLLDGPEVDRLATALLQSPAAELLVARLMQSGLLDEMLDQLVENKRFWLLVDEVAQSPGVTTAISHQSRSFADEVAGDVRGRSERADDWLERRVRLLARRRSRDESE
jgi:hypothetical protein